MLPQRIFDILALEASGPGAFDMRLIMVDAHDLGIVCYTYVEYNESSRGRAHNSYNPNKSVNSILVSTSTTTSNTIDYPTMEVDVHIPTTTIPLHQ